MTITERDFNIFIGNVIRQKRFCPYYSLGDSDCLHNILHKGEYWFSYCVFYEDDLGLRCRYEHSRLSKIVIEEREDNNYLVSKD